MKRIFFLGLSFFLVAIAFPQAEISIETDVSAVTVYFEGAHIVRTKDIELKNGITVLKFQNLSPYIDASSIQLKAKGELTVLSVNHQINHLMKTEKTTELKELEKSLSNLEDKIQLEKVQLAIIGEELGFLKENKSIGGRNQEMNLSTLKAVYEYYSTSVNALMKKEIANQKSIRNLTDQIQVVKNQIKTLSTVKETPSSEILVKIDAPKALKANFELSYLVENAGWFPTYDIRAKNVEEPISLTYKANVRQDTKVDWKDVHITLSTAEPATSGTAPALQPYLLNYHLTPPRYEKGVNRVRGKVITQDQEPVAFANLVINGTTIGTVTDFDGNYSLIIPPGQHEMTVSFIGCETKTLPITNSVMNIVLEQSIVSLDEVEIVEYGIPLDRMSSRSTLVGGVMVSKDKMRGSRSGEIINMPVSQIERQTAFDFEIDIPFTINADGRSYTIDILNYDLPAIYQYYAIPKIEKNAYLMAYILDWEQFNLLEGEANVFFEDAYIGKTLIDVRFATDTLSISLGKDKGIQISREMVKSEGSKRMLGSKKEETRIWKNTVKNNKKHTINMLLLDQVPVSTNTDIEVGIPEMSNAKHESNKGEIRWEFELSPGESKQFNLQYTVKYPRNRNLYIE
jgi:hypothetical protein